MILNTIKLQEGGSIGSSSQAYGFIDYVPFINQQPTKQVTNSSHVKEKASEKSSLLSDEMIKSLLSKGLTNDVHAFISMATSMLDDPFANNPFGSSIDSMSLERKQLGLIGKINEILNNKSAFDKAVDNARSSGALDEVAVTSYGLLIATNNDTGQIEQIRPEELYEARNSYTPMTNADLARLRMTSPKLAFDNNIFNILENAVGSKEIDQFIRTAINEANSTTSQYNRYISASELKDVKSGLEKLQNGIVEENITNEDNAKQIESAMSYLYNMMPDNYKKFLAAKSATMGKDPIKGTLELIQDYANTKRKLKTSTVYNVPASLNKSDSDSEGKGMVETDTIELMASGTPLSSKSIRTYEFNTGTQYSLTSGMSPYYNDIRTIKGDPLAPIVTLNTLLTDTNLASMLDKASVSVGTQVARPVDLSKIGIDTTQGYTMVMFPTKIVNGRKVVDLDLAKKIDEVKKSIPEGATPAEIKQIYAKNQIEEFADADGSVESTKQLYEQGKIAPFLVMSGYASDNNFIADNHAADLVNDANTTREVEAGINADRVAHNMEELDFTSGVFSFDLFGSRVGSDLYKVSVFVPYSPSAVTETLLANGHVYSSKSNRKVGKVLNITGEDLKTSF